MKNILCTLWLFLSFESLVLGQEQVIPIVHKNKVGGSVCFSAPSTKAKVFQDVESPIFKFDDKIIVVRDFGSMIKSTAIEISMHNDKTFELIDSVLIDFEKRKIVVERIKQLGDRICIFLTEVTNEGTYLNAIEIVAGTDGIELSKELNLQHIESNVKNNTAIEPSVIYIDNSNRFEIYFNDSNEKIVSCSTPKKELGDISASNNNHLKVFAVFDYNLKKLSINSVRMPMQFAKYKRLTANKDNTIYGLVIEDSEKSRTVKHKVELHKIKSDGTINILPFDQNEMFVTAADIVALQSGDVMLTGFYRKYINSASEGIFKVLYNGDNYSKIRYDRFSLGLYSQFNPVFLEDDEKRIKAFRKGEIGYYHMDIVNLHLMNDGSLILIGNSSRFNQNGNNVLRDFLIIKLNHEDHELAWISKVPRQTLWWDYSTTFTEKTLYLTIPDSKLNVNLENHTKCNDNGKFFPKSSATYKISLANGSKERYSMVEDLIFLDTELRRVPFNKLLPLDENTFLQSGRPTKDSFGIFKIEF